VPALVPDFVSHVAVIVTLPFATPVTTPVELTVALDGSLVPQVIVRPASAFPLASFGVATNTAVAPAFTLNVAGLTETLATATGVIVAALVPTLPSEVALIAAVPAAIPVTSPDELTVATELFELDHVTTLPVSVFPRESLAVAVSC